MKLFPLIKMQFSSFTDYVKAYLSKTLNNFQTTYGSNTVFGQIINVLSSTVQNIMLYIEDAMVEQNKYTAQRKKSIYGLAVLSGYNPGLGKTAGCTIQIIFKPTTTQTLNILLTNKTKLICSQNGLIYNIILPQEAIVLNIENDNSSKFLYAIEGKFETQTFFVDGGQLYSQNVKFNGDMDIDYLTVKVNNEVWERKDSLYDMDPDGKQYVCKTSIKKGIDLLFGNNQFGRQVVYGDKVEVTYLIHSGELGNINPNEQVEFMFQEPLKDINGEDVDANNIFNIKLIGDSGINSGTYSETTDQVREMIGYNSRALVLADPKNYKNFINKFSFCGYNRTWCEEGSLVINSLILKNYKMQLNKGVDYFSLNENDFYLTKDQKDSIKTHINNSGQQLAGVTFNIFDPELCKYACYIYVKTKSTVYDQDYLISQIKNLVGDFFANVQSDIFIPKSDIVHLLKSKLNDIDSVNVYFISERNERALKEGQYMKNIYKYDPVTGLYNIKKELIHLYPGEDPGIGLDTHGNIYLDNNDQFPVLMGGWNYKNSNVDQSDELTAVTDPLIIVFE